MSKSSRETFKARRNEMNRQVSAAKQAAGLRYDIGKRDSQAEIGWRAQITVMPDDTRTITGYVLGDPVPGDPRCPWRPSSVSILGREGV